jgi:hypothetical protein
MTEDRKAELAKLCAVQIRQASAIAKSRLADYGYHLVEAVVDAEVEATMERLADKSVRPGDIALLRELVIADLWPRLREAHKEHRVHLFESLKLMHLESVSPHASFAVDIGCATLIQAAADRVETYPAAWKVTITGGKEKLGCCVIHIDYDGSQRGARSEIERLREEFRLRSLATCDICGGQGRLRLSSIAKTACDRHAAVLGEMRDDDGLWADPWRWHEQPPIGEYIDDNVGKARAIMAAASAEVEMDESNSPFRMSALGRRIDDDTWSRADREQELLIEYGYHILDAVRAARSFVDEQRSVWISGDVERWDEYSAAPLSDTDRAWLLDYVLTLAAERNLKQ